MDGLSLALAMLAWVLIALLSLFVGIIVLRALRYSLDAMDAPKQVGQVIRQEQPTRVTDIVLASIEATGESKR